MTQFLVQTFCRQPILETIFVPEQKTQSQGRIKLGETESSNKPHRMAAGLTRHRQHRQHWRQQHWRPQQQHAHDHNLFQGENFNSKIIYHKRWISGEQTGQMISWIFVFFFFSGPGFDRFIICWWWWWWASRPPRPVTPWLSCFGLSRMVLRTFIESKLVDKGWTLTKK